MILDFFTKKKNWNLQIFLIYLQIWLSYYY